MSPPRHERRGPLGFALLAFAVLALALPRGARADSAPAVSSRVTAPGRSAQAERSRTPRKGARARKPRLPGAPSAARSLRRGIAAHDAGRCEEALFELEVALELGAAPIAHFYLGRCQERVGNVTAAVRSYSRFVFESSGSSEASFAASRIAALYANLIEVEVIATPAGAEVHVDGQGGLPATPARIHLTPGTHTLRVSAPDHLPETRSVSVVAGAPETLRFELKRAPGGAPRAPIAAAETAKPGWKGGAEAPSLAPHAPGSLPVGTGVANVAEPADDRGRPAIRAVRAVRPPEIDGILDDPEWRRAEPVTGFTQKAPYGGRQPSEKTTLRVLYDDDAIYVAFHCEQPETPIIALLSRRDRPMETDSVTVAIDSRSRGQSAFEFTVSAAGTLIDGIRFDDGKIAREWDENWEARAETREGGWSAELRIPLRTLRFERALAGEWGFQARRYVSARQETDEWAYVPRELGGEVSHYGRLRGLRRIEADHSLQLTPSVLGEMRHQAPDDSIVHRGLGYRASAGLDLRWHPSESVALDGTFNPDFGQVEADQLILNLSKVEALFPEKRPFFLAGMDDYATPATVFYSRRIGRTPQPPRLGSGPAGVERLFDYARPSPIYGALKLAADLPGGWTAAGLSAVTGAGTVDVVAPDGVRGARLADPLTSFNVLRLRNRLARGLDIGALATATVRAEPGSALPDALTSSGGYPVLPTPGAQRCPGGALTRVGERCFHDAYVASADLVWTSPAGEYAVRAQTYGSAISRGPRRTLPDGTVIGSGDLGAGGVLRLSKQGGEHWLFDGSLGANGEKLDYNDLGFMPRQNQARLGAYAEYRTLEPFWGILETHTALLAYGENNLRGLALGRGLLLTENVVLDNRWTLTAGGYLALPYFDDREVGDGTALERSRLRGLVQSVSTDPRRPVSFTAQVAEEFLDVGGNVSAQLGLLWQPHAVAQLQLLSTYTHNRGDRRYAGTGSAPDDLVFGRLDARSAGVTLRAAVTLVPTLTLQAYAQAFFATGQYSDFVHYAAPATGPRPAIRIAELVTPGAPPAVRPDFERGSLAVNVVLRWEYRLGSTIYLLWVRSQNPNVDLLPTQAPRINPQLIESAPANDVVMLKVAYWIG